MEDKILIEDDIVDLTDLLEEGNPPSGKSKDNSFRKRKNEPDSFDLGKEISMEYEVSVEEIEQDAAAPGSEKAMGTEVKSEIQVDGFGAKPGKEPLLDIEKEIDLAIQDKFEDVSLTSKEEEMLLKDEPLEEPVSAEKVEKLELETQIETEAVPADMPSGPAAEAADADLESPPEDKALPEEAAGMSDLPAAAVEAEEPEPRGAELEAVPPSPVPESTATPSLSLPVEAMTGTLVEELKKEMPALLESIMRPLVRELLQEVMAATRDALPSLVEKVIREEIEKLKKI
jgi:hypothetical protein